MKDVILIPFSKHEFKELVKDSVNEALNEKEIHTATHLEEIFSVKDAAKFLNLAPQTLYGFTSKKTIPFFKRGKKLYFKKSDLEKWISEGKQKSNSEISEELSNSEDTKEISK